MKRKVWALSIIAVLLLTGCKGNDKPASPLDRPDAPTGGSSTVESSVVSSSDEVSSTEESTITSVPEVSSDAGESATGNVSEPVDVGYVAARLLTVGTEVYNIEWSLSEVEARGWVGNYTEADVIAPVSTKSVQLEKNGDVVYAIIRNNSTEESGIYSCQVCAISCYSENCAVGGGVVGEISVGMPLDDALTAMEGAENTTSLQQLRTYYVQDIDTAYSFIYSESTGLLESVGIVVPTEDGHALVV